LVKLIDVKNVNPKNKNVKNVFLKIKNAEKRLIKKTLLTNTQNYSNQMNKFSNKITIIRDMALHQSQTMMCTGKSKLRGLRYGSSSESDDDVCW